MRKHGDFPRPEIGGTPLLSVRVRAGRRANLHLKLESFNPFGSIKDRTAVSLFDSVAARLEPAAGLVESTSGNLGVALAALARSAGVPFTAVVDPLASTATVARMRELRARIVTVTEADETGGYLLNRLRAVRELLARHPGLSWTNQYDNPANPRAHALGTGPELGAQVAPDSVVLVPVSTGGTLAGIRAYAERHRPGWTVIGVDVNGSYALGHSAGTRLIPGIGSSRHSGFVAPGAGPVTRVDSAEAVAACMWLLAETGFGVGGSSGALVAAALRLIDERGLSDVVCVCPDGARNYLDTVYSATWRSARSIPEGLIKSTVESVELAPYRGAPAGERLPWFLEGRPAAEGSGTVTVLDRADVTRCLAAIDTVAVARDTLAAHDRGLCELPDEAYLRWTNAAGEYTRSLAMPGAVGLAGGGTAYGMKVINASVGNPRLGLDRATGIGLCFHPETARITTLAEVGLVSAVRTAATSAVAIEATGYGAATSLSVLGCGVQGGTHLALLLRRLPALRAVTLFDREPAAATALAERLSGWLAAGEVPAPVASVSVAAGARAAVGAGQVVLTTTTADEGYVEAGWIAPGALVVNVSLADLRDEALLTAGALYVDDVDLVRANPRRPLGRLMRAGLVAPPGAEGGARRLDGTIGGLLTGRYQPVPAGQRYAVVNPFGMGLLDVALLHELQREAAAAGAGTPLRLG